MNEQPYARIECEWTFRCPRAWHLLTPTAVEEIRYCEVCERSVHLAANSEELRAHAAAGHCVAVVTVEPSRGVDRSEDDPITVGRVAEPPYEGRI